ncbi:hypothetical protein J7394_21290, partial [Ruegeria sp. R13_0]|uniref:hypothetical protein n=1 Tax=Ruegeria sp. R13_0 TaxID=2821099 RepID=UPI001ADB9673
MTLLFATGFSVYGSPGGHDHHSHGDHIDHSAGYIPPPTDASEVEAYVAAVKALPDAHAHGDDPSKAGEH